MPADFATFVHFAISDLMNAPSSSRVDEAGSMAVWMYFSRMSGKPRVFTIAALSVFCIGVGTPDGTQLAYQAVTSNPGMPDSATVGTSGSCGWRFSDDTASARVRPA